ncbi:hypothetical protein [Chlamydia sp. 17-3921]|uniref:hypothetical protein n=1 Tax=Chlamydia sp. 17-3921 TaxID=2675798 RepID=UPI00191B0C2D|nr:hypothetical protein [Chlamydia sp. 17-3921]
MQVTSSSVFMVNHRHNSKGCAVSGNSINLPLQNPLYRNCLEEFLSYIPVLSINYGIRTFIGISTLKTSLLIRTGYLGDHCQMEPCSTIREQLPKIYFHAWLECFGVKGLYYIFVGFMKIISIIKNFLITCCRKQKEPEQLIPPLTPEQAPFPHNKNDIDIIFG